MNNELKYEIELLEYEQKMLLRFEISLREAKTENDKKAAKKIIKDSKQFIKNQSQRVADMQRPNSQLNPLFQSILNSYLL